MSAGEESESSALRYAAEEFMNESTPPAALRERRCSLLSAAWNNVRQADHSSAEHPLYSLFKAVIVVLIRLHDGIRSNSGAFMAFVITVDELFRSCIYVEL